MKLSSIQINQIRDFVAGRGFTEPDLQIEILDHMVCRVEDFMTSNTNLSLEHAVQLAHSEFGVMGFSIFEDAMRSALQKRYLKLFKRIFLGSFQWKYLPLMAAFIYLANVAFQLISLPEAAFTATGIVLIVVLVVNGIFNAIRYKRYTHMLTFKMGSVYLILSTALFQAYNILIVQLRLYKYLNANLTGLLFAVVLLVLMVTFYAVNTTQQHAVASCHELEQKYAALTC
jgi:tryptophan-rich sensory protein